MFRTADQSRPVNFQGVVCRRFAHPPFADSGSRTPHSAIGSTVACRNSTITRGSIPSHLIRPCTSMRSSHLNHLIHSILEMPRFIASMCSIHCARLRFSANWHGIHFPLRWGCCCLVRCLTIRSVMRCMCSRLPGIAGSFRPVRFGSLFIFTISFYPCLTHYTFWTNPHAIHWLTTDGGIDAGIV
jgi:hypothetical protein